MSGLAYLQQKLITINTVYVNCDPQAKVKGGLRRSVQDTKKTSKLKDYWFVSTWDHAVFDLICSNLLMDIGRCHIPEPPLCLPHNISPAVCSSCFLLYIPYHRMNCNMTSPTSCPIHPQSLAPPHIPLDPQFQFATVYFVSSISLHYSNNVSV